MSRRSRSQTGIKQSRRADASNRLAWAFETPEEHWAGHDRRQIAYWRTRSAEERLAQACEYRRRRHGDVSAPAVWSWRFLSPDEH